MATSLIQDILFQRLIEQERDNDEFALYVLAACEGQDALDQFIGGTRAPQRPEPPPPAVPLPRVSPTYLTGIQVRSFRGIGSESTLRVTPGPGVTLVVGRNGSGKSSFAEGVEVALTGTSARWSSKGSREWLKGWRNVHSALAPRIVVEMMEEGQPGPSRVERTWDDPADLSTGRTIVVDARQERKPLSQTGLPAALEQYRPFLSYSELGGLLSDGPGRIYQALLAGLGLEDYEQVRDALANADNTRKKLGDASRKQAVALAASARALALQHPAEGRFGVVADLLEKRTRDIAAIAALVTARPDDDRSRALEGAMNVTVSFAPERVPALVTELRAAADAERAMRGRSEDLTLKVSEVLRKALTLAETAPQEACPVCGSARPLDAAWQAEATRRLRELDDAAKAARDVSQNVRLLVREAQDACRPAPEVLRQAADVGLPGAEDALAAWSNFAAGATLRSPDDLAAHLDSLAESLRAALAIVIDAATVEAERRDVAWQPLALEIAQWVPAAQLADRAKAAEKQVKEAKEWVAAAIDDARQARFAPVKQQAIGFWNTIAQLSNVTLEDIELTGQGIQQRVTLKVSVDGQEAPALGVLSQGELNAMTLSLFLPRVLMDATPFGFVIVDDPVQAMDEARVDGLARVLTTVGEDRQVVVFTHDARLPEAFDRLDLPHSKRRVTRGISSSVGVSPLVGTWEQRLEDAMAVVTTSNVPEDIAGRVVPGFCRQALEAACFDNLRRRWLLKGDAHAKVEERLARRGLRELLCLVFFEDEYAQAGLSARLKKIRVVEDAAAIVQDCQNGAHEGFSGNLKTMVNRSRKLCEELRKVKAA